MSKNRKPLQLSQALDEGLDQAARDLSGLTDLVQTIQEASEKTNVTPTPRAATMVAEALIDQSKSRIELDPTIVPQTTLAKEAHAAGITVRETNEQLATQDQAQAAGQGGTDTKKPTQAPTKEELNKLRDMISNLKFKIHDRTSNPFPSRSRQVTSRENHQGRGRPMVAGSVSPSAALAVDLFAVMMDIPVSHVLETMILEFVKANPKLFANAIEVWIFRRMAQAA